MSKKDANHVFENIDDVIKWIEDVPTYKRRYYTFLRGIRKPLRWPWDIRMRAQRARQGYSTQDVWNFDNYLAEVISKGVLELKEMAHGHPGELTFEEWQEILDKISKGFALADAYTSPFYQDDELAAQIKEAQDLFTKYFFHLWD